MDLNVIPTEEVERTNISLGSLRDKPKVKPIKYEVEKKELSKNIQKFDKKPRVYTENPYAHNTISLKKKINTSPTQGASELITNPLYNRLGKFLGVDTLHDWNRYYDKVYVIAEWAKAKSGDQDLGKLISWISKTSRLTPNMGMKEIDSLYLRARLYLNK